MSEARTHTMRAQIELRRKILNGDLAGGTRLFEVTLAEEMNISRTPVREAMSRLVEEGLLERGRRGGFVVRSFEYPDLVDTIELRGVLEGTAARLAAERGASAVRMKEAGDILEKLDACFEADGPDGVDFEAYSELNARFHEVLARLPGSSTIQRELDRVTRLPFAAPSAFVPFRLAPPDFRQSLLGAQAEHRKIIEAIAAREGSRAEALAREHARTARVNLARIFGGDRKYAEAIPALALVASDSPA